MYNSNQDGILCSESEQSKHNHSDICQDIPTASSLPSSVAKQQSIATATVSQEDNVSECQNALISTVQKSPVCCPSSPLSSSIVCKTEDETEVSHGKIRGFFVINSHSAHRGVVVLDFSSGRVGSWSIDRWRPVHPVD